jgi:carboxypeptidase T
MIIIRNIFTALALFLFLFYTQSTFGQSDNMPIYQKVRIHLNGHGLTPLAAMGIEVEHGYKRSEDILVNFYSIEEVNQIKKAGYTVDILQQDALAYYLEESKKVQPVDLELMMRNAKCQPSNKAFDVPGNFKYGSMGSYLTFDEIVSELDLMRTKYPNLITAKQSNPSIITKGGNRVYYVKISDFPDEDEGEYENQMLFTALHHSREPMSMMQMIYFMWYILEKYDTDPEIKYLLNKSELFFMPCVNPDGYIYNQQMAPNGGGLWRKNRNNANGSGGIDLNRNYGVGFAYDNNGSSPLKASDTYRGPYAFSEQETKAIHLLRLSHQFKIAINYHSFANMMIYPWGYLEKNTVDSLTYTYFAQDLTQYSDYRYGLNNETLGYPINGTADDYLYDNGVYSYTFECGGAELTDEESFWPLQNKIQPICAQMVYQNLQSIWLANGALQYQLGSDNIIRPGSNVAKIIVTRTGLENTPTTLSIRPLTPNLTNFNKDYSIDLGHLQKSTLNVPFSVNNNENGIAKIEINAFYGGYLKKDTLTFKVLKYENRFENGGDDLSVFVKQNFGENWELDQEDYYDTFSSITLTNNATYDKAENKNLELKYPVYLPTKDSLSFITFFAKWNIEKNIDHVKVYASSDGIYWEPLCGNFSQRGNIDQGEEEPVLDGFQPDWVQLSYNISNYIGESIYFKIVFRSDAKVNKEGIKIDKIRIISVPREKLSAHNEIDYNSIVSPNPASNMLYIHRKNTGMAELRLYDTHGKTVLSASLSNQMEAIDVRNLISGVYIYQIYNNLDQSPIIGKVIISK